MNNGLIRLIFAILNALGIAGVGTYLAGHKKTGLIQICISLTAFALTLLPFSYLCYRVEQTGTGFLTWYWGLLTAGSGSIQIQPEYLPLLILMVGGVILFTLNLLWSLTTTRPTSSSPHRIRNPYQDKL